MAVIVMGPEARGRRVARPERTVEPTSTRSCFGTTPGGLDNTNPNQHQKLRRRARAINGE